MFSSENIYQTLMALSHQLNCFRLHFRHLPSALNRSVFLGKTLWRQIASSLHHISVSAEMRHYAFTENRVFSVARDAAIYGEWFVVTGQYVWLTQQDISSYYFQKAANSSVREIATQDD